MLNDLIHRAAPPESDKHRSNAVIGKAAYGPRLLDVYGFGEQKTPESFRQACRRFIYTENLLPEAPTSEEPERADLRPAAAKQAPSTAAPLIRKAIAQLDDDGGWVPLGRVGQRLAELASDFDPRTYGQAKLSDLVDKAGAFEVRRTESGHVQIRVKIVNAKGKK
ncbi:OST-HTH/LOTUS domain-containing protein [Altererythrobacter sp. H2]|uniref:OST-HTH/LOTUS domain-containing protein n=1 Tax=Altererythrobacter sp. H2 TaxID=3108391 RepID=UPI003A5CF16B